MIDMIKAIRKNTTDQVIIIGGGKEYAYNEESQIYLDGKIKEDEKLKNDKLLMYNFHPYMDNSPYKKEEDKSPEGFEAKVKKLRDNTDKPIIITEFGQYCCKKDGECGCLSGT